MASDVRMFDHPPSAADLEQVFAPAVRTIIMTPTQPNAIGFRIGFGMNSASIPADAIPYLDSIAQFLAEHPQLHLIVEGHTDASGSDRYNLALSARRARAVRDYIVRAQGVSPQRLSYVGKGRSEPLTSDPYSPENRRVQFVQGD
ncbi:putative lipoprotein [Azospirillum melinis]